MDCEADDLTNSLSLTSDCKLLCSDLNVALEYHQVVDYLENADTTYKDYINTSDSNPPVQPKGGTVFLFDLGLDEAQWEVKKKKLRCDQYKWVHKGTRTTEFGKYSIKKKTGAIDVEDKKPEAGDNSFKRLEFWGIGSSYLIHYLGNHTIYKPFQHRNCKKSSKPFVRSAPHIKEKVLNKGPMVSTQNIYQQIVNEDEGGPWHVINTPRNQNQIKNFKKEVDRQFRISHDAFFNTYQLCYQLQFKDRKGESKDFLRHFQIYPTVCIHLIPHPLLENLEVLLKVSSHPVILHYDTVFNMGDFYLSTLVCRNSIFQKDPITPVAFFIHSRRLKEDHLLFMKSLRHSLPLLASKRLLIVTDREFDFSGVFPLCLNAFCWNHLERDLHFYLKNANCKPSEISFYANAFKALMIEESEEDFNTAWISVKNTFTNSTVLQYFEQKLLPAFKEHSSIWKLRDMGVSNPENGLTNNPAESMNAVLHNLQGWKQVPLDVICVSLFHLSCYYQRETIRAYHLCGSWQFKDAFTYLQRDPSLIPFLPKGIDPKDIVNKAREGISFSCNADEPCSDTDEPSNAKSSKANSIIKSDSQLALAKEAIYDKRVMLTDKGCWMVRAADDETPYAVRLFPKESCSCPSVRMCYHIMACKLMIGQEIGELGKPNMTHLNQKIRRKNKEKPSGRKPPHMKKDFDGIISNFLSGSEDESEKQSSKETSKRKRDFEDNTKGKEDEQLDSQPAKKNRCDSIDSAKQKEDEFDAYAGYEEYLKEAWKDDDTPPVDVSEKMRHLIKNAKTFSLTPIGPIGEHIVTGYFHQIIPPSFASSFVVNSYEDCALFHELFKANNEKAPDVIVYPHQTEIYETINNDRTAYKKTVAALKLENPTIANLLIDSYDAHSKRMYRSDSPMVDSEKCTADDDNGTQIHCSADGVMQTVFVESSHCLASQDLSKFAKVNLSPFSLQILNGRNANVAANREFFCNDTSCQKLKWETILRRIENFFPQKLLCLHVCNTGLDEEIACLTVGKIVVIQTKRNNQVAFLKRLPNENEIPAVQVVSAYNEPDKMELNYHVGIATRTLAQSALALHTSIQCFSTDYADVITAVLLIIACMDEHQDLAKIDLNNEAAIRFLQNFLSLKEFDLNNEIFDLCAKLEDCYQQPEIHEIKLYCFCLTPWIDGSTSVAIYNKQQKEYKAYQCCICLDWFHKACLVKLNVSLPKRQEEFVCSRCTIPTTLQWSHSNFTNTCTSDNFLTILMLHCQQHPQFLSHFGDSEMENSIKAGLALMVENSSGFDEGKSLILKVAHSKLNFPRAADGKLDCYGTENSGFLCLISHVWKLQIQQQCISPYCPNKNLVKTGYQTTFSFTSDTKRIFPIPGHIMGYCGSEFPSKPPRKAQYTVSDRIDATANSARDQFYACKGESKVLSCQFVNKSPWVVPISIESISLKEVNDLPLSLTIYDQLYWLGGCTINTGGHFVSIIMWHGCPFYYDGLKLTKQQRFIKYCPNVASNLKTSTGSYAYYFL